MLLFDTTLRDGAQSEGITFSVRDKLRIAQRLDELGADVIEGGWPGANETDTEFFAQAKEKLNLTHSRLGAFGSTRRRPNLPPEEDPTLQELLRAETPVITIFGKSWGLHVTEALKISLKQNLELILDSITFLKSKNREVFYDAEHFFDGYKANANYAVKTLQAAAEGGADCLVLCDTNGGTLPTEISAITRHVIQELGPTPVGIHCHNDAGLAVANSLAAVEAGAVHVQGTMNGIGERCGNADLAVVIPNLQLKMNRRTSIDDEGLKHLTSASRFVNEMINRPPRKNQPYVGDSAFAHKGGIHVSAVMKNSETYEHIPPELVGNRRNVLVSKQSGRSNLIYKLHEFGLTDFDPKDERVLGLLKEIKDLEHGGYQFDGADASFELLARKALGMLPKYFSLHDFRIIVERRIQEKGGWGWVSDASLKVETIEGLEHTAAEGDGPVNAVDRALRKALSRFYPMLQEIELVDFKVRILSNSGTDAVVRVFIESKDAGTERWGTVGVHSNIIAACYEALVDSIVYKLVKDGVEPLGM
ncbi:MAG: citramalate synthase [Magnetococcales bacterium]|nr:citramalate synthase [Magnetococcales bacterium]